MNANKQDSTKLEHGIPGMQSRSCTKWRDSRGATLVETAVVLPLLLLLTFAVVDFATFLYVYLALENGVSQATRYAVTGQTQDDPGTPATNEREIAIKNAMRSATPTLTIPDAAFVFEHLEGGSWVAGSGGNNQILRVTVNYGWSFFTPLLKPFFNSGLVTLRVSSTMKNEAFAS
jgi:Flp pilus assembly protein TadG